MAESKQIKGTADFSQCTFESLVRRALPAGVSHMIKRCLKSFGPDHVVLAKSWTEVVDDGSTEAKWFAYSPPTDICCADAAAWALSLTGAIPDIRKKTSPWKAWWKYANGTEEATWFHAAPFWAPEPRTAEHVTLVRKSSRWEDFVTAKGEPVDDNFLPGDYFLYSQHEVVRGRAPDCPSHINLYIGPFQEVVDGAHVGPVFHMYNGSLGLGGSSAYVKPVPLSQLKDFFCTHGWTVWQCRVNAVARLYQQLVGLPIAGLPDDKRTPGDKIDELWKGVAGSISPFPVGRSLTWHDGVHIDATRPVTSGRVASGAYA